MLTCTFKEIMLYPFQLALCADMSPEFGERGNVRVVRRSVASFIPIGHSACALAPLTDAALYRREGKSNSWDWHRGEIILKDNANCILVLKTR